MRLKYDGSSGIQMGNAQTRRQNVFKIGLTVSLSAGAPPKNVTKSMARQLKWMGVAKRYQFPLASMAGNVMMLSEKEYIQNGGNPCKIRTSAVFLCPFVA